MDIETARSVKAELFEFSAREARGGGPAGLETKSLGRGSATQSGPQAEPFATAPPVAIGIAPSRDRQGAKVILIGTDERLRDHPLVERALRMGKGETEFFAAGVPEPLSHWQPSHRRPLQLGVSIGHEGHPAGTLGAFITMPDGTHCMLSANHVLAGVNAGQPGDPVIQPGRNDGGTPNEPAIGTLRQFVAITGVPGANQIDCAVADLAGGVEPTTAFATNAGEQPFSLTGLGAGEELFAGDPVVKFGRTTGRTAGKVFAVEVDNYVVNMGARTSPWMCRFDGQIQIYSDDRAFASPGDSGALVVDPDGRAHGLLFAGSVQGGPAGTGLATANVLEVALRELDAKLWLG